MFEIIAKINQDAFEKFISRHELARVMQKEQEMYQSQLNHGVKIRPDGVLDSQKRMLLKEISLPSNEDFTKIDQNLSQVHSTRRQNIRSELENDSGLKDISNFIDQVFTPAEPFCDQNSEPVSEDSLDVIQEQLFEETHKIPSEFENIRETAGFGAANHDLISDDFLPNQVQKLDQPSND